MDFRLILEQIDSQKQLSEESKKTLVALFEEKMTKIKDEAYEKAADQANEKLDGIDAAHAEELTKLVDKIIALYEKQLKELKKIIGEKEEELDKKDADDAKDLEEITDKMDKKHAEEVEKLVESIDTFCCEKLNEALEMQDAAHSQALKRFMDKVDSKLIVKKVAETVDTFLESYLEEVTPKAALVNEAELAHLKEFYGKVKELTFVNDDYVRKEITEAVKEADDTIASKDATIDKLLFEKAELNSKLKKIEASKVLSESVKDMQPSLRAYIETRFKDASKEEIEASLNEAVEAFKAESKDKRAKLVLESKNLAKVKETPTLMNEEVAHASKKDSDKSDPYNMSQYVGVLNKISQKRNGN